MTVVEGIANLLVTGINVALLFLVLRLYRGYRIDALRHRLFVLRGELFDYALVNGLAFNDPAYVMLRASMNSLLRFARKMAFGKLLVLTLVGRRLRGLGLLEDHERQWHTALARLPEDEHRKKIAALHEHMLLEFSKHMALGAPVWLPAILNFAFLNRLWQRCQQFLLSKASIAEVEARYADSKSAIA